MAEDTENESGRLRKLALPAAVSIAGAGAGLVLSNRSKLKESVPDLKDGVGDLTTDLRSKLDSVLGKNDSPEQSSERGPRAESGESSTYTPEELAARRRERQERRTRRRANS